MNQQRKIGRIRHEDNRNIGGIAYSLHRLCLLSSGQQEREMKTAIIVMILLGVYDAIIITACVMMERRRK